MSTKNGLKKSDLKVSSGCAKVLFNQVIKNDLKYKWIVKWKKNIINSTAETGSRSGYHITYLNYSFFSKVENPIAILKNTLLHELIHIYLFETKGIQGHGEQFLKCAKLLNYILAHDGVKKERIIDHKGKLINPQKERKLKNPDPLSQAKKLFQDFNRYPPEKLVKMKLPIDRSTVFLRLGDVDNIEYISDKKIYSSDTKTKKRKSRTYIHNFSEHGKAPILLTNQAGNILIIFDPNHEIEVKAEGII